MDLRCSAASRQSQISGHSGAHCQLVRFAGRSEPGRRVWRRIFLQAAKLRRVLKTLVVLKEMLQGTGILGVAAGGRPSLLAQRGHGNEFRRAGREQPSGKRHHPQQPGGQGQGEAPGGTTP